MRGLKSYSERFVMDLTEARLETRLHEHKNSLRFFQNGHNTSPLHSPSQETWDCAHQVFSFHQLNGVIDVDVDELFVPALSRYKCVKSQPSIKMYVHKRSPMKVRLLVLQTIFIILMVRYACTFTQAEL